MKVYDCFLFFNELDLLEIRLNELNDVVDNFVIVESTESFSKKKKPLYFLENKDRFSSFLEKIIHVVVDDTPDFPDRPGRMGTMHSRHDVEWFQRDCISRGLVDCKKEDIVILSDIDEIPSKNAVLEIRKILSEKDTTVSLNHRFFYYFLNGLCVQNGNESQWWGSTACRFGSFPGPEALRRLKGVAQTRLNGGWHFSYLGGPEMIALKIESIAHAEWDNDKIKNLDRIKSVLEKGEDLFDRRDKPRQVYIQIDETFPCFLVKNQSKFSHLIHS